MEPRTDRHITLHIGASKCGSSALQRFLSHSPTFDLGSQPLHYVVIDQHGTLLTADAIRQRAARSAAGYASSASFEYVTSENLIALVSDACPEGHILLSNEGWLQEAAYCRAHSTLAHLEGTLSVLVYVRPQTQFLNSAWWQWGAWARRPTPGKFLQERLPTARWFELISGWRDVPGVDSINVRLLPESIVEDMLGVLGWEGRSGREAVDSGRSNRSLPGDVLRVLQRHAPRLRNHPHASEIDFVLERAFEAHPGRTPWIIDPGQMQQMIDYYREDNERLLELLDAEQQDQMRADIRWWEPYDPERPIESPLPVPAADPVADALLADAFAALLESDRERRRGMD